MAELFNEEFRTRFSKLDAKEQQKKIEELQKLAKPIEKTNSDEKADETKLNA